MKKSLLFLFFLIPFSFLHAQVDSVTQQLQSLFPSAKLQWTKHYKGRIDDANDINISLASDGKFCRGIMTYLRSQEKFMLEGSFQKDSLKLTEFDANKKVTGFIKGFQTGKIIDAVWSNNIGTIGGIIVTLHEKFEPNFIPTFCADNKWVRAYKGSFSEYSLEILLQKGSYGNINGVAYSVNEKKSYHLKGSYNEAKLALDLVVRDDFGNKIGNFTLRQRGANDFVGQFLTPDGKKRYGEVTRNDNIDVGCMEYADYMASYDITFPKLADDDFNLWMQGLVDEWFRINVAYINSLRYDNLDNVPNVRNVARAYGWSELSFHNKELSSGFMVYGNSWTNRQHERSFIYDFTEKRELIFSDIFKASTEAQTFVKEQVASRLKKHLLYQEPDFKDWIATQKFDNMSLRQEGINFSSYSLAYGRQGVTIPYTELMSFLAQRGAVWNYLNQKVKN